MNNTTLSEVYDDERRHSSTVYTSKLGIGLNCFSSVLSATSSIALIVIFLRSDKRLSSLYHRRIMSIAVATLVTSLAMAFSTLPMPKDMIYTAYEGIVAGSTLTCDIQYFFISLGAHFYYWFILILALYYVCRIVFSMSEYRFKKRIEIPMHIIAAVHSVGSSALLVWSELPSPSPFSPPYCTAVSYPYWCYEEDCDLLRGTIKWTDALMFLSLSFVCFVIISMFICLILTVIWVYAKERSVISLRRDYDVSNDIDVLLTNNLLSTRASFIQAMCYLLVYGLGSIFSLIRNIIGFENLSPGLQIGQCLINPSDGFFNALIFVSIEVHNLRMAEASHDGQKPPLLDALRRVVTQGDTTNVAVISHLSIVCDDIEAIVHVQEDDGPITLSKCSVKADELENVIHNIAQDYVTENLSPAPHNLPITTETNVSANQDYASESFVEDFNSGYLSYPTTNESLSEGGLSQNVSGASHEASADGRRNRNSIVEDYQVQYTSKNKSNAYRR
jgi:hypothetical protein